MKELQSNSRNHLLNTLLHFSSIEMALNYKDAVPFVNVSNELFEQWHGGFKTDQKWFREAFTKIEYKALEEFDVVFKQAYNSLPKDLPDIDILHKKEQWQSIMKKAQETLSYFPESREW